MNEMNTKAIECSNCKDRKIMPQKSQLNVRVSSDTLRKLTQLTEQFGETKTGIMAIAIDRMYREDCLMNRVMDNYTRDEMVKIFGEDAIAVLDRENCDFTNRVIDDGSVEFSASIMAEYDGTPVVIKAYYYQWQHEVDGIEDLDQLSWEISHYDYS